MTTKICNIFRIITLKEQKLFQSNPVLIRQFSKKLQFDPVLIHAHLCKVALVSYRIRILEPNPAGYLEFFGIGLVWISFPFQPDPEPDYPNEINCDYRKNLKWINSFMKKKYTTSNDIGEK